MTPTRRVIAEKRRYIYPLVGALLVNAVLLGIVVLPLSRKVEGGEEAARDAAVALAAARRDFAAARATVAGKDSADVELKKFYSAVLPADQSEARRIAFKISELAKNANLTLERASTTRPSQERGSALGKLTIEQTVTGQYRDIRQFIFDIETAPEFLILEHVGLSAQGREGSTALRMDIRVATYYRAGGDGN
jgi:Tfp pilus assembly protein PilO